MSIHTYTMPEKVKQLLPQHAKLQGDYVPPHDNILIDAITILAMGKNLLLKGPTGSGKTKLAETLVELFQQNMYSINCSVDLDAESLMGFKTLDYKEGKQHIDRKSTRLNSSHVAISYAVFCLKTKTT